MLARRDAAGHPAGVPIQLVYDARSDVWRAPARLHLATGDMFQLRDGTLYRVARVELVRAGGEPCFQEAVCDRLGKRAAPLRTSWEGAFPDYTDLEF